MLFRSQAKESRFRSGKAGGQTATRASDPKKIPGFDYQDYKLGPGDIITAVGGKDIATATDLQKAIYTADIGDTLEFTVIGTNRRERTARVVLTEAPTSR